LFILIVIKIAHSRAELNLDIGCDTAIDSDCKRMSSVYKNAILPLIFSTECI